MGIRPTGQGTFIIKHFIKHTDTLGSFNLFQFKLRRQSLNPN